MFVAAAIVSGLFAVVLVASASFKLTEQPATVEIMTKVEFPLDKLWLLAGAELAGAVGLVVGLFWWPIGVAAAIGVVLYFLGAVAAHVRVHDQVVAPAILLVVAIAALVLRATTTG